MRPTSVLATVTGRDRPGVTSAFFAALAAHDVEVRDVEQVLIRDRLFLSVLFDLRGDPSALRSSAMTTARALGMECEVLVADEGAAPPRRRRGDPTHVMVLGRPLRPGAVGHVAQAIADLGDNIDSITQSSDHPVASLDLVVRSRDARALRTALVQASEDTGIDIAVEPAALQRRSKRLLVLDLESTLLQHDPIELLAERAGTTAELHRLAARERNGEIACADVVRARAGLLAGLDWAAAEQVRDAVQLAPGADEALAAVRALGHRIAVVSSGFGLVTDRFAAELGLDGAIATRLEVVNGELTGHVAGPVLDRAGKAQALVDFAAAADVPLDQTVAVGDGADDLDLLAGAGTAIAYNARSARRAADPDAGSCLDSVLFVLGAELARSGAAGVSPRDAEDR
jgi:phosphoserine phosphatase